MGTSGTGFFDNDGSGDWFDTIRHRMFTAIDEFIDNPEGAYQEGIAALNVLANLANQDMPIPIPMWNFYDFQDILDSVIITLNDHQSQIPEMGWRDGDLEIKYQKNIQTLIREIGRIKVHLDEWAETRRKRTDLPPRKKRARKRTN